MLLEGSRGLLLECSKIFLLEGSKDFFLEDSRDFVLECSRDLFLEGSKNLSLEGSKDYIHNNYKARALLWCPPWALGIEGTPQGEVRDNIGHMVVQLHMSIHMSLAN